MPIKVADGLPAVDFLRNENVFVMTDSRAVHQGIRPLKMLVLNLMPKKIETENQFLRLLSNSSLQVDVHLLRIDHRSSKNTPEQHLNNFYYDFEEIRHQNFDGLIITGAPLGQVEFADVLYWQQIQQVILWAKQHVTSTLFMCWAALAGLNVLYGLPKLTRKDKLCGVYQHRTFDCRSLLTRGFDDKFLVPHSRYAAFPIDELFANSQLKQDLQLLAEIENGEAYLLASKDKRLVFVTGHPEYDAYTLAGEFLRDLKLDTKAQMPVNYFPDNNPNNSPHSSWRSHAYLLFANWLNYYVYQITPYDLAEMSPTED